VYTLFASGKTTEEAFVQKRGGINDAIAWKRSQIEGWGGQLKTLTEGRETAGSAIAELAPIRTIETLGREVVDLLIDRILAHGENDIEIVWNGRFEP
jgi:hypothetical protein